MAKIHFITSFLVLSVLFHYPYGEDTVPSDTVVIKGVSQDVCYKDPLELRL